MELSQFTLLHTTNAKSCAFTSQPQLLWKTCLRSIYIGLPHFETDQIVPPAKIYQGKEAYQFLLQVVCGLESPMIGETEVFGQFKNFIEGIDSKNQALKNNLKILIDIRNTAKKIRAEHLINLGAQSYGSLLRKHINFNDDIHIIGSGQFVEEIIPWLTKKSNSIFIHCRNPKKAKSVPAFSKSTILGFSSETDLNGVLIIAAPVSATEIVKLINLNNISMIYDLRGESEQDPLQVSAQLISLKDFFQQIENNKTKISKRVDCAKKEILYCTNAKLKEQKLNPFGWDDICA